MSKEPVTKESLQQKIEELSKEIELTEIELRQVQNEKYQRRQVLKELEQKNRDLISKKKQIEYKQGRLRKIIQEGEDAPSIHESKWGFHPCSRTHYQKLKYLRARFYEALRKEAAWKRWTRRKTTNRWSRIKIRNSDHQVIGYERTYPIQEPPRCPLFSRTVRGTSNAFERVKGVHQYRKHPDTLRNTFVDDMGLEKDFILAQPQEKLEDVIPLEIPERQLDRWIKEFLHLDFLEKRK